MEFILYREIGVKISGAQGKSSDHKDFSQNYLGDCTSATDATTNI